MARLVSDCLHEMTFPSFPPIPISAILLHLNLTYEISVTKNISLETYLSEAVSHSVREKRLELVTPEHVRLVNSELTPERMTYSTQNLKRLLVCRGCKEIINPSTRIMVLQCVDCLITYHSGCATNPAQLFEQIETWLCDKCQKKTKPQKSTLSKCDSSMIETTLNMTAQPEYITSQDKEIFKQSHSAALDMITAENSNGTDVPKMPPESSTCRIMIGSNDIEAWHSSAYPQEFSSLPRLFLCSHCLAYMKTARVLKRHEDVCQLVFPPGNEIYRHGNISVFEVDGNEDKIYCQNLCLLARLFLVHKTLYYDVEPFVFYVLTVKRGIDKGRANGGDFVGYFSKEKNSGHNYNLSCIMVLPVFQRCGYGRFLIELSYFLSRREGKTGSPEKPLTEHGRGAYMSYWRSTVLRRLFAGACSAESISIKVMSDELGISTHDIAATLQDLGILSVENDKLVIEGRRRTVLFVDWDVFDVKGREGLFVREECLHWRPPEESSAKRKKTEESVQCSTPMTGDELTENMLPSPNKKESCKSKCDTCV